jgi:hypothetical protein
MATAKGRKSYRHTHTELLLFIVMSSAVRVAVTSTIATACSY